MKVLVEIDGGVAEAICAEPTVRSLRSRFAEPIEITVCSRHCDLYRNHPAVANFTYEAKEGWREEFDECFRLASFADFAEMHQYEMHPVDFYAEQAQVKLIERVPWICLDSFDYVRAQRFNIEGMSQPRIVIATDADDAAKTWDKAKWRRLCELLEEKLGAGIAQIADCPEQYINVGKNLTGRVSPREAAAVISCCDLLISADNGYVDLAAAVQTPTVVLLRSERDACRVYEQGGVWIAAGDSDSNDNNNVQAISVEDVVEGILSLCQQSSG